MIKETFLIKKVFNKKIIFTFFLFIFLFFYSCENDKNLNPIKSKTLNYEIKEYLKRADEITNNEVKQFHLTFYKNKNDCLFEINYANHSYILDNINLNDGHFKVDDKIIFLHGIDLLCSDYFIDKEKLNFEKIDIKESSKDYKKIDDLFQLYLITTNGKFRRLAKT